MQTVVYKRFTRNWGQLSRTTRLRRRQRRHPRARRSGRASATPCSSTSGTWTRASACRTRCTSTASATSSAPTARSSRASPGAAANVPVGQHRARTGCAAKQGSVGVWPYHDHSSSMHDAPVAAACTGDRRSAGDERAEARPRERRLLPDAPRLHDDQRPRLHREHADLPLAQRASVVQWNVLAIGELAPHVPPARPPLALRERRDIDTRRRRPGRELPVPHQRGRSRARGSTTATSSPTWTPGCSGSTRSLAAPRAARTAASRASSRAGPEEAPRPRRARRARGAFRGARLDAPRPDPRTAVLPRAGRRDRR